MREATRPAGGAWGAPRSLSAAGEADGFGKVAVDPAGDATALWVHEVEAGPFAAETVAIQVASYDATPPQLRALSIPATGTVGQSLPFAVTPFDVSSPAQVSWVFGDGSSAIGDSATHTYSAAGTYEVKVTGTDAAGNASTASGTVVVGDAASNDQKTSPNGGASVAPHVRLRYTPNRPHRPNPKGGPRYTFRFAGPTGEERFYCRLDRAPFRRCRSPKAYRHLKRGRHVFRVKAVAADGTASPVRTVRFFAGRRRR
ncbi:MAG TPA: PKD domain-containing protein [Solirubrobacterales bacterium]